MLTIWLRQPLVPLEGRGPHSVTQDLLHGPSLISQRRLFRIK